MAIEAKASSEKPDFSGEWLLFLEGIDYNAAMKFRGYWFLIVASSIVCLTVFDATGSSPKIAPELIGTWDYTSMTALKSGKPFGTVHFQPGQWTVTFNQDATWVMKTPSNVNPRGLNGSYEIHGRDLDMKLADGRPYYKNRYALEQDGKVLVLTDKEATISANKRDENPPKP